MTKRVLVLLLGLVLVVLAMAGAYVGYAAIKHARTVALPRPTGPLSGGPGDVRLDRPSARTDPLASRPGTPRELVRLALVPGYPSGRARARRTCPARWNGLHFGSLPGSARVRFGADPGACVRRRAVAAGRFSVVVLLPGLGFAAPQYTALAEDIASHGYLVAGVTPTYTANLTVLHRPRRAQHRRRGIPGSTPRTSTRAPPLRSVTGSSRSGPPTPGSPRDGSMRWDSRSPGTSTWRTRRTSATPSAARRHWRPVVSTRTARAPWTWTAPSSARSYGRDSTGRR